MVVVEPQLALDRSSRAGSHCLSRNLTVVEEDDGRDREHPILLCQPRTLVDIDLHEGNAFVPAARSTPVGVEVDDHAAVRTQHLFLESGVVSLLMAT